MKLAVSSTAFTALIFHAMPFCLWVLYGYGATEGVRESGRTSPGEAKARFVRRGEAEVAHLPTNTCERESASTTCPGIRRTVDECIWTKAFRPPDLT